jgi:hypothetical protein
LWLSWPYVERSWAILEHSQEASGLPLAKFLRWWCCGPFRDLRPCCLMRFMGPEPPGAL